MEETAKALEEIKKYLEDEKQDYAVGLKLFLKHKTDDNKYFEKNKGAKKGTMPHNLLISRLERISFELSVKVEQEAAKKNSSPALNTDQVTNKAKEE